MNDNNVGVEYPTGVMRAISGMYVNIGKPDPATLLMADIAWGLGRQLRYNGHMQQDYTIAHHCIIMSYYVPEEYALEALLHDASETYTGDIIYPLKELLRKKSKTFDTIDGNLSGAIFNKFGDAPTRARCVVDGKYVMSDLVHEADHALYKHEAHSFDDGRPGEFSEEMHSAWMEAVQSHEDYWGAAYYCYMHRYFELIKAAVTRDRINELVAPMWYRNDDV